MPRFSATDKPALGVLVYLCSILFSLILVWAPSLHAGDASSSVEKSKSTGAASGKSKVKKVRG